MGAYWPFADDSIYFWWFLYSSALLTYALVSHKNQSILNNCHIRNLESQYSYLYKKCSVADRILAPTREIYAYPTPTSDKMDMCYYITIYRLHNLLLLFHFPENKHESNSIKKTKRVISN